MISSTSPPEREAATLAGDHEHARVAALGELGDQVAQVRVDVERQRVELLGPVERDRRDAVVDGEIEVLPLGCQRRARAVRAHRRRDDTRHRSPGQCYVCSRRATRGIGGLRQPLLESEDRDARARAARGAAAGQAAPPGRLGRRPQPVVQAHARRLRRRSAAVARRPAAAADADPRGVDGLPVRAPALRRAARDRRRRRDPDPHDLGHDRQGAAARARLAQGLGLDRRDVGLRDLGLRDPARRHRLHRVRLRLVHRLLGPALLDGEDRRPERARRRPADRDARAPDHRLRRDRRRLDAHLRAAPRAGGVDARDRSARPRACSA